MHVQFLFVVIKDTTCNLVLYLINILTNNAYLSLAQITLYDTLYMYVSYMCIMLILKINLQLRFCAYKD